VNVRWPGSRAVGGVLVLALVLVNLHSAAASLRAHARLREAALTQVRARVESARPYVSPLLAEGGASALDRALQQIVSAGAAERVDAFAEDGRLIMGYPPPAPDRDWPSPETLAPLARGSTVLVGPTLTGEVLAFSRYAGPTEPVVLRMWAFVPDVGRDLGERQQLFVAQVATLALILLLGLVLAIPNPRAESTAAPGVLGAYEEAMERLHEQEEGRLVRHIEERRRLQGEIQEREPLARAGELTAGVVHEVRNGLGTILGYARLLETAASDETAQHGRSIREECETLETVVRRFMEFVKTESLQPEPFDLGRMLQRVAARESRSRSGAEVTIRGEGGTIVADEELLERAFENLVRNAREAAGPEGHVEVSFARTNGQVEVAIADDGPGLGVSARESLRPFFTTKAGGLGLGLPLALKIVRLHGGDLTLGDRVPRGLLVTVRLPDRGV
jgi:signal transduction histidine kinase